KTGNKVVAGSLYHLVDYFATKAIFYEKALRTGKEALHDTAMTVLATRTDTPQRTTRVIGGNAVAVRFDQLIRYVNNELVQRDKLMKDLREEENRPAPNPAKVQDLKDKLKISNRKILDATEKLKFTNSLGMFRDSKGNQTENFEDVVILPSKQQMRTTLIRMAQNMREQMVVLEPFNREGGVMMVPDGAKTQRDRLTEETKPENERKPVAGPRAAGLQLVLMENAVGVESVREMILIIEGGRRGNTQVEGVITKLEREIQKLERDARSADEGKKITAQRQINQNKHYIELLRAEIEQMKDLLKVVPAGPMKPLQEQIKDLQKEAQTRVNRKATPQGTVNRMEAKEAREALSDNERAMLRVARTQIETLERERLNIEGQIKNLEYRLDPPATRARIADLEKEAAANPIPARLRQIAAELKSLRDLLLSPEDIRKKIDLFRKQKIEEKKVLAERQDALGKAPAADRPAIQNEINAVNGRITETENEIATLYYILTSRLTERKASLSQIEDTLQKNHLRISQIPALFQDRAEARQLKADIERDERQLRVLRAEIDKIEFELMHIFIISSHELYDKYLRDEIKRQADEKAQMEAVLAGMARKDTKAAKALADGIEAAAREIKVLEGLIVELRQKNIYALPDGRLASINYPLRFVNEDLSRVYQNRVVNADALTEEVRVVRNGGFIKRNLDDRSVKPVVGTLEDAILLKQKELEKRVTRILELQGELSVLPAGHPDIAVKNEQIQRLRGELSEINAKNILFLTEKVDGRDVHYVVQIEYGLVSAQDTSLTKSEGVKESSLMTSRSELGMIIITLEGALPSIKDSRDPGFEKDFADYREQIRRLISDLKDKISEKKAEAEAKKGTPAEAPLRAEIEALSLKLADAQNGKFTDEKGRTVALISGVKQGMQQFTRESFREYETADGKLRVEIVEKGEIWTARRGPDGEPVLLEKVAIVKSRNEIAIVNGKAYSVRAQYRVDKNGVVAAAPSRVFAIDPDTGREAIRFHKDLTGRFTKAEHIASQKNYAADPDTFEIGKQVGTVEKTKSKVTIGRDSYDVWVEKDLTGKIEKVFAIGDPELGEAVRFYPDLNTGEINEAEDVGTGFVYKVNPKTFEVIGSPIAQILVWTERAEFGKDSYEIRVRKNLGNNIIEKVFAVDELGNEVFRYNKNKVRNEFLTAEFLSAGEHKGKLFNVDPKTYKILGTQQPEEALRMVSLGKRVVVSKGSYEIVQRVGPKGEIDATFGFDGVGNERVRFSQSKDETGKEKWRAQEIATGLIYEVDSKTFETVGKPIAITKIVKSDLRLPILNSPPYLLIEEVKLIDGDINKRDESTLRVYAVDASTGKEFAELYFRPQTINGIPVHGVLLLDLGEKAAVPLSKDTLKKYHYSGQENAKKVIYFNSKYDVIPVNSKQQTYVIETVNRIGSESWVVAEEILQEDGQFVIGRAYDPNTGAERAVISRSPQGDILIDVINKDLDAVRKKAKDLRDPVRNFRIEIKNLKDQLKKAGTTQEADLIKSKIEASEKKLEEIEKGLVFRTVHRAKSVIVPVKTEEQGRIVERDSVRYEIADESIITAMETDYGFEIKNGEVQDFNGLSSSIEDLSRVQGDARRIADIKLRTGILKIAELLDVKDRKLTLVETKVRLKSGGDAYHYRVKEDPFARIVIFRSADPGSNIVINTDWLNENARTGYEFSPLGLVFKLDAAAEDIIDRDLLRIQGFKVDDVDKGLYEKMKAAGVKLNQERPVVISQVRKSLMM
ncbi:MAG TPA: hypothetical protein VD883_03880, partial [Candidatus Omnitrophota bacterium]|nr:hypothetical protein [Candidatus Omnitrophota bacterium]